jgi:hypothetical protein
MVWVALDAKVKLFAIVIGRIMMYLIEWLFISIL